MLFIGFNARFGLNIYVDDETDSKNVRDHPNLRYDQHRLRLFAAVAPSIIRRKPGQLTGEFAAAAKAIAPREQHRLARCGPRLDQPCGLGGRGPTAAGEELMGVYHYSCTFMSTFFWTLQYDFIYLKINMIQYLYLFVTMRRHAVASGEAGCLRRVQPHPSVHERTRRDHRKADRAVREELCGTFYRIPTIGWLVAVRVRL